MLLRILPAFLLSLPALGQGLQPTLLTELDPLLFETSGLMVLEGQVWTHGDSGNSPVLYRVDPATGSILREVVLSNATNVDWEEVASDDTWVYVGDIGNNLGNRTDLRFYRFPLQDLLNSAITSVLVDTIRFAYADQTDFTPAPQATNWDCEAFIAQGDSLYLFTKNWADFRSYVYVLPARPGTHLAQRRDTLEAMGLITAASLDRASNTLVLLGYDMLLHPFVWRFSGYMGTDFFDGLVQRHSIALSFAQTEAVAWSAADTVLFTNEAEISGNALLWELALGIDASVNEAQDPSPIVVSPNPASQHFQLLGLDRPAYVSLRDEQGAEVLHTQVALGDTVNVAGLANGLYLVELEMDGVLRYLRVSVLR